jgi:DNA processing protein
MTDLSYNFLKLTLVPGVGIQTIRSLLEKYLNDLDALFSSLEVMNLVQRAKVDDKARQIYDRYRLLTYIDAGYPQYLKILPDAPMVIYYQGDSTLLTRDRVAVVGTRNPSRYGIQVTQKFIPDLVARHIVIVSGMAFGIDQLAHEAALDHASQSTIAVLASPVDQPTPESNRYLYERIIAEGGLIISATTPGTQMQKGLFASRNRIVAGLARATLVIEAGEKSGALITANLAFDYDRLVFALPGNINLPKSVGTNLLIKQNKAQLVQSASDILVELNYSQNTQQNLPSLNNFTNHQNRILAAIRDGYDNLELLQSILPDLDSDAILSELLSIELAGLVIKSFNGSYHINL